jgi:D-alanyl-D-alanine endopeptidase (penicillin-binding protein 7)
MFLSFCQKIKLIVIKVIPVIFFLFLFIPFFVQADDSSKELIFSESAITKEQSVSLTECKVIVSAQAFKKANGIKLEKIDNLLPENSVWQKNSALYQFSVSNPSDYKTDNKTKIIFNYSNNNYLKQIFFFDSNYKVWRPLPSIDNPKNKTVTAFFPFSFVRLALFSNPNVLAVGEASYYGYKSGNYAASPDFPKGTKLRVYNLNNNKFVDVEINDFGPDRKKFPTRVIDLEKQAFKKIAPLSDGLAKIKIEILSAPSGTIKKGLKENKKTINNAPVTKKVEVKKTTKVDINSQNTKPKKETDLEIESKSGIVLSCQDDSILWEKDSNKTFPVASLTKLVAIKVFLGQNIDPETIVTYRSKDEKYNLKYCSNGEAAKLSLKDGEKVKIKDLLYSSLIASTNNTIETLVRVSGLGRETFILRMNKKAAQWGATTTHFIEPTGLSPKNVSSAADYAIIAKEVFQDETIQKITTLPSYTFYTVDTKKKHYLKNTSRLVREDKFDVTGSKTGYLHEAGYCLATRAIKDDKEIITVTLGAQSREDSFKDTENLLSYGLKNYSLKQNK